MGNAPAAQFAWPDCQAWDPVPTWVHSLSLLRFCLHSMHQEDRPNHSPRWLRDRSGRRPDCLERHLRRHLVLHTAPTTANETILLPQECSPTQQKP